MATRKYKDIKEHYNYNRKYNKEHYDQIHIYIPAGDRQRWRDYAAECELSLAQFIIEAVEEKVIRDGL